MLQSCSGYVTVMLTQGYLRVNKPFKNQVYERQITIILFTNDLISAH